MENGRELERRRKISRSLKRQYASGERKVSLAFSHAWLGKKRSKEDREKMSRARIGRFGDERHPRWAGDRVGYDGLHDWVYKVLGAPMTCSRCGRVGKNNYQIHWANKNGKYKRTKNDWIRLCVRCHWWKDQANKERIGSRWVK